MPVLTQLSWGFLSVSYIKSIPTHAKILAVGESGGPNATFNLCFSWVGLAVGWGVRRFHNNVDMFSNPTEIGTKYIANSHTNFEHLVPIGGGSFLVKRLKCCLSCVCVCFFFLLLKTCLRAHMRAFLFCRFVMICITRVRAPSVCQIVPRVVLEVRGRVQLTGAHLLEMGELLVEEAILRK